MNAAKTKSPGAEVGGASFVPMATQMVTAPMHAKLAVAANSPAADQVRGDVRSSHPEAMPAARAARNPMAMNPYASSSANVMKPSGPTADPSAKGFRSWLTGTPVAWCRIAANMNTSPSGPSRMLKSWRTQPCVQVTCRLGSIRILAFSCRLEGLRKTPAGVLRQWLQLLDVWTARKCERAHAYRRQRARLPRGVDKRTCERGRPTATPCMVWMVKRARSLP